MLVESSGGEDLAPEYTIAEKLGRDPATVKDITYHLPCQTIKSCGSGWIGVFEGGGVNLKETTPIRIETFHNTRG